MSGFARPLLVATAVALFPGFALAQGRTITLEEAIAAARRNPRVMAARADTLARRAQVEEAKMARWTKFELRAFAGPSPDIRCENPECTRTSNREVQARIGGVFTGVRLEVIQPVYTFGKISAASQAARHAVEANRHLTDLAIGDQTVDAVRAYYGVKLARELRWMLEEGLERLDRSTARLESSLEEGSAVVTVQDRLRVKSLRSEIASRLAEAAEAEAVALASLRALVGEAGVDVDDRPLDPVAYDLAASAERYVAIATDQHPELAAARAGALAADALVAAETARLWPDLVVAGRVNLSYAQGTDNPPSAFFDDPFNARGFGGALVLEWNVDPLVQLARRHKAEAEAQKAEALAVGAEAKAGLEVTTAFAEARAARARLDAIGDGVKAARGWVASVIQSEAVGTAEAKDLADAYIAYFGARARLLQSTFDFNVAIARLQRALGAYSQ